MAPFKSGDLVQLKSGGPKMTVKQMINQNVQCQWFAGSKLEDGNFHPDSLQPAQDDAQNKTKQS